MDFRGAPFVAVLLVPAKAVAEMIASPQDIPALPGLREVKV